MNDLLLPDVHVLYLGIAFKVYYYHVIFFAFFDKLLRILDFAIDTRASASHTLYYRNDLT